MKRNWSARMVHFGRGTQALAPLVLLSALVAGFVPYVLAAEGVGAPDTSDVQPINLNAPELQKYDYGTDVDWTARQKVSGDFLVSSNPTHTGVTVTSLPSLKQSKLVVSIKNATGPVNVYGAATLGPHGLAVVGTYSRSGTPGGFLAFTDLAGQIKTLVDTGVYAPRDVCVAKDGTVWVLGDDVAKERRIWAMGNGTVRSEALGQYGLLQQYAPDGKRIGARLPRNTLRPRAADEAGQMMFSPAASNIVCGEESVGAYIVLGGQEFWYETKLGDTAGRLWEISGRPALPRLSGISAPFLNTVYGSFETADQLVLSKLQLGSNSIARWVQTDVRPAASAANLPSLKLLGNQADRLVLINGVSQAAPYAPILSWVRVGRSSIGRAIAYEPPADQAKPASAELESKGVQGLVQVASEAVKKLASIAAVCDKNPDCASVSADLKHQVSAWSYANRQGTRTQATDAQTARALDADMLKLNASMQKVIAQLGLTENQSAETTGAREGAVIATDCDATCMTDGGLGASELGLASADDTAADSDNFEDVGCSADCSNMFAAMLAICAIGAFATKGTVAGVVFGLACIAFSGYLLHKCNLTCDPVCDCQKTSDLFPDIAEQGPRTVSGQRRLAPQIELIRT
jgi:hypothetical protein